MVDSPPGIPRCVGDDSPRWGRIVNQVAAPSALFIFTQVLQRSDGE